MTNKETIVTNVSETILSQLYNRGDKETFLRDYLEDDATRESYAIFLLLSSEYERLIGKDLYLFSSKDILDMFGNMFTSSPSSLRGLFTICKQYLNWSTGRGLNTTGSNPFSEISFKEHVLPMLNMRGIKNNFLTEEEVWKLCSDFSINPQDTACLLPVFYGIRGSKCCELINLKIDDIDGVNNTITLATDISKETGEILATRTIGISKELIKIFEESWGQDEYKRRGKAGKGDRTTAKLYDSEYVLRPTTINSNPYITSQTCATRCKKILQDANLSYLSIMDIYNSGKIHALKQLEKLNNGLLTIDNFKYIQNMFGDSMDNYANAKLMYETYMKAISKVE